MASKPETDKWLIKAQEALDKSNFELAHLLLTQQVLPAAPFSLPVHQLLHRTSLGLSPSASFSPGKTARGVGPWLTYKKTMLGKDPAKQWLPLVHLVTKFPRHLDWRVKMAELALKLGQQDLAVQCYGQTLDLFPNHALSHRALGKILSAAGDFKRAEQHFLAARQLDPNDFESQDCIRELHARHSEQTWAKADGARDMIKDKDSAERIETSSHLLHSSDDIAKAIAVLEKEMGEKPADVFRFRQLGDLYLRQDEFKKALAIYEAGLKSFSEEPSLLDRVGDCRLKEFDALRRTLKEKQQQQPSPQDPALDQKLAELKKIRLSYAVSEFSRRVKDRPTETSLRFSLAMHLKEARAWDQAIAHFQITVKDARFEGRSRLQMALCFAGKKEFEAALTHITRLAEKITVLDDFAKEVTYCFGRILEEKGDREAARTQFQKIYEEDISYRDVQKRLDVWRKE